MSVVLYVADSAVHRRRGQIRTSGASACRRRRQPCTGGEVFATTIGIPDGMRVDVEGNVWASAGAKIDVYAPDGDLLGQIVGFPAPVTNLTFGGPGPRPDLRHGRRLLFAVGVAVAGAQTP